MRDRLLRTKNADMPWSGRPAGPRGAGLHGQPHGPRPAPGRPRPGRPPRPSGGPARVPEPGAGQCPGLRVDLPGPGPGRRASSMIPAAGSFAPNLATTITSAPSSAGGVPTSADRPDWSRWPRTSPGSTSDAPQRSWSHGDDIGPDRLDQGERRRARGGRRGGRGPDRRGDPPPARARSHPGRLGVRRLGQPAGRAAAAQQAYRNGLHPHRQLDENHLASDKGLSPWSWSSVRTARR